MSAHPSPLVLDTYHVDPEAYPGTQAHIASCSSCQAYLVGYPAVHMPAAIALLRQPRSNRRWWWAALALPALASIALVILPEPGVREKGAPVVALYVKHGERVTLWDGQQTIVPGDSLRLRVSGAGYRFVAIEDGDGGLLYRGAIGRESLLPVSFAVDGVGNHETLIVVLTSQSASEEALRQAKTSPLRRADAWSTTLVVPKKAK